MRFLKDEVLRSLVVTLSDDDLKHLMSEALVEYGRRQGIRV